jgi:Bifunctional DNA primase/polymerase, N-terminal
MSKISFFNENGLCVIPVHPRSKQPKPRDWQKRRFDNNEPAEFSGEANYGVVLGDASSGIVDIDLDSELARRLAPYFLPKTGWCFGRRSTPKSHWLYRVSRTRTQIRCGRQVRRVSRQWSNDGLPTLDSSERGSK